MLGPDSNADEARPHPTQYCRALQDPYRPRETSGAGAIEISADLLPDDRLHALRQPGRELAAAL